MSEQVWIAIVMGVGAVAEGIGVSVIAVEIRRTRRAFWRWHRKLVDADFLTIRPKDRDRGFNDYIKAIVEFLAEMTEGGRRLRWTGYIFLIAGIMVTLAGNLWAVLGLR